MSNLKATAGATGSYSPLDTASELLRVLDQYLADLQAGKAPDKAKLLAEHPELAGQLEQCLAGMDFVHRAGRDNQEAPAQLGDFRIVREVGRGGMGVVYEAEQISLKRRVALKVLRFGIGTDAEVMKRFQREAETVAQLHHTNIVPIHAVGCEQGVHYYAMQFIEGRSLAAVIEERRPSVVLSLRERTAAAPLAEREGYTEIARWGLQAAEALAHAHQRGVIHRDIKPSNLILDPDGTVWLTDFGLAKRADEVTLTAAGVLMGTPRYMSPEQAAAAKQPIDHRTDIYSLGATLYELATGKPVFESQTPQGVITQILNAEPVAPRLVQSHLPRDLETIILKCLAKEPVRRYQQARDLADDLRAYLENRAIKARRPSLAERAARWLRKHSRSTVVSVVSAAASLLLIIGGFFGWREYQQSRLAHLSLTTDGPSRVAEVLDEQGDVVLPSFPVPTTQPVALPAGKYTLRFSSAGMLSEDWQIQLDRSQKVSYPVKLLDRNLWPPFEVTGTDPALIELNGQTHLWQDMSLRHGATGRNVWRLKLPEKPPPSPYPEMQIKEEWGYLQQKSPPPGRPNTGDAPGLATPPADLDGDGLHDLILASRHSPSLLAVSGKDGKMLWWFRAAPNAVRRNTSPQREQGEPLLAPQPDLKDWNEGAAAIGRPIVVEVDGEPVVIAPFVSFHGNYQPKDGNWFTNMNQYWLEAVDARTGKSRWRTPSKDGNSDLWKHYPNKLEVVKIGGRPTLLLPVQSTLSAFDLKTGKELWPGYSCEGHPVQGTKFADLDGDGEPDALFVHRQQEYSNDLKLRAVALKSRTTLWELPKLTASWWLPDPGGEMAWVADLDGDGKPEVILSVRDDWQKFGNHWVGVEVLDGATGSLRWQSRLCSLGQFGGTGVTGMARILVGPDLDGDGHRELFTATAGFRQPTDLGPSGLQIDALSGKDGRVLWRQRPQGAVIPGRLQWWQTGEDGWPQLLVPVPNGAGGQPITYILAASTGRITHTLPEVADAQVADINGDNMPDLYRVTSSLGSRRFVVFRGLPPTEWRRPGNWRPAKDYDGDGNDDFLQVTQDGYAARSSRDGRVLWQTNRKSVVPPFHLDVNGDGVSDIVIGENVHETIPNSSGLNHTLFTAISGKDGQRLWTGQRTDLRADLSSSASGWGGPDKDYHYPLLDKVYLDGDGQAEILVAATANKGLGPSISHLRLAAISSKDGSLLWKVPMLERAFTGQSLIDRNLFGDLNGDGVRDVVLWVPEKVDNDGNVQGALLKAFSGRDGKPLWADDSPGRFKQGEQVGGRHGPFAWPRTAIADLDGDGKPEVVLTTFDSDNKGNCELVVLDGTTGRIKWRKPWIHRNFQDMQVWPPLIMNVDGAAQRLIALGELWADNKAGAKINFYDAEGNIAQTIPTRSIYRGVTVWAAIDLDGDGKEELLYPSDKGLTAYRPHDRKALWTWGAGFFSQPGPFWGADAHIGHGSFHPGAGFLVVIDHFRPGAKGQPGTVIVRAGRDSTQTGQTAWYGLNALTGEAQWRCDVPVQEGKYPHMFETALFFQSDSGDLPLVVTHHYASEHTLVQLPLPTNAEGTYRAPQGEPITYADFVDRPRPRTLPWVNFWLNPKFLGLVRYELLFAVVFGLTLATWTLMGKGRRVLYYLLFFALVTVVVAIILLRTDASKVPADEAYAYLWDGWYWIMYLGSSVTGLLTVAGGIVWLSIKAVRRLMFGKYKAHQPAT